MIMRQPSHAPDQVRSDLEQAVFIFNLIPTRIADSHTGRYTARWAVRCAGRQTDRWIDRHRDKWAQRQINRSRTYSVMRLCSQSCSVPLTAITIITMKQQTHCVPLVTLSSSDDQLPHSVPLTFLLTFVTPLFVPSPFPVSILSLSSSLLLSLSFIPFLSSFLSCLSLFLSLSLLLLWKLIHLPESLLHLTCANLIFYLEWIWRENKKSIVDKHCRAKQCRANICLMLTAIHYRIKFRSTYSTYRRWFPPLTSHNTTPLHRSLIFFSLKCYTSRVWGCHLFLLSVPIFFFIFAFLLYLSSFLFILSFPVFDFFRVIVLCLPLSRISIVILMSLNSTIAVTCRALFCMTWFNRPPDAEIQYMHTHTNTHSHWHTH